MDINLLLEPRGSKPPASKISDHSYQDQDDVLSQDYIIPKAIMENNWERRGDSLYGNSAPTAAFSVVSDPIQLIPSSNSSSGIIAAYHHPSSSLPHSLDSTPESERPNEKLHRSRLTNSSLATQTPRSNVLKRKAEQFLGSEVKRMNRDDGGYISDNHLESFDETSLTSKDRTAPLPPLPPPRDIMDLRTSRVSRWQWDNTNYPRDYTPAMYQATVPEYTQTQLNRYYAQYMCYPPLPYSVIPDSLPVATIDCQDPATQFANRFINHQETYRQNPDSATQQQQSSHIHDTEGGNYQGLEDSPFVRRDHSPPLPPRVVEQMLGTNMYPPVRLHPMPKTTHPQVQPLAIFPLSDQPFQSYFDTDLLAKLPLLEEEPATARHTAADPGDELPIVAPRGAARVGPVRVRSHTRELGNNDAKTHDFSATERSPELGQAPFKARNFSVLNHLPSDSGYQSGLGTDTGSVTSDVSRGSSLGVSRDFVHDFVAFFGDTLIDKSGAQQWAQFALAHSSQSEIEKRLTALLRAFAVDLAAKRSTPMALDDGTDRSADNDQPVQLLLDGAIKLVRRYRPMIARYFLEHSVSSQAETVSLSDRLQGLGRHFSLAERVDLLVHQSIREIDDEDEDNIVDENIIAQLEPVQAMLVSGAAFRNLALELRRSLYRDDEYRTASIRAIVLENIHFPNTACWTTAEFLVKWDVMGFMRSQYSKLPSVASTVVLTGSALYAQATTCSDYVRTNWPTTGSIVLDLIDKALASEAEKTSALVVELEDYSFGMRLRIEDDCIELSVEAVPKYIIDEIAQLLAWIGSALSNSPFGENLAYGVSSVVQTGNAHAREDPENLTEARFGITYKHEPLHTTESSCWLPLFNGMTIVPGFPIPNRGEEIGLEISLELLAAIAGISHIAQFDGGLVMKGFGSLIVPVQTTKDRVQWHAITSQDNDTYLSYHDGLSSCKSRLSLAAVGFDDIQTTRAFLGWCSVYTSRLGSKSINYDNIDYSGAGQADTSIHLNGAQVGFQQWATATANFSIGAQQTRHYIERDGPFRNIMSAAERTPVLLFDTSEQRGYLVSATDVMLHVIQHRHRLEPFEVNNKPVVLETCVPIGSTAKDVLKKNQNVSLSDDGKYTFKKAIHSIWSIFEDLRAKTVTKNQDAQGIAVEKPFSQHLYGYEFKAIVQERGDYTLMEKRLSRNHGGWPLLVRDINALILLADGFGDLILPADEHKSQLCNVWQRLPSGCDYLATTCNVLTDMYDVAGSRTSRNHLTTTHLQWHQGESQLFDSCKNTKACKCNRLQQIVSKSDTVVRPKIGDNKAGAVIFGNCDSLLRNIFSSIRPTRKAPETPFYQHPNVVLVPIEDHHSKGTVLMVNSSRSESITTTVILPPPVAKAIKRHVLEPPPRGPPPEVTCQASKKRDRPLEQALAAFDQDGKSFEGCENFRSLKRKSGFQVESAT